MTAFRPIASAGVALLMGLSPAAARAATQPYVVTSFDSIRLDAPVRVLVRSGGGASARGEGDRDTLDRIDLQVSSGLLVVRLRPPAAGANARGAVGPATLILTTQQVRRVQLSGGGSISVEGMKGQRGDIALAGSGDIAVSGVALDRLVLMVAGNGRLTLSGTAAILEARLTGAGSVAGESLRAKDAKIVNQGPGAIVATVGGTADISTAGSGDVTVLGAPSCTVARGGTGALRCGGKDY
jgi:hypothetical protein